MTLKLYLARIAMLAFAGGVLASLAGCTGRGATPTSVLRTEDFIADPATMPTAVAPSPVESTNLGPPGIPAARTVLSVAQAREGVKDLSIKTGAPPPSTAPGRSAKAAPSESLTLVDAKIGEINGRSIRVGEMFEPLEKRLAATAESKHLTPKEWYDSGRRPRDGNVDSACSREDFEALAFFLFRERLDSILEDEVLTAEARSGLTADEKMGLQYFLKERREDKRRAAGGSKAELDRQLRAQNKSVGQFSKDLERRVLVESQIQDKFRSRLKTSWKDVRLYWDRNPRLYRPPPKARFRKIQVDAENAEGLAAVRDALASKRPFSEVAGLPANEYRAAEGGLIPDDVEFQGEFVEGDFFAATDLNAAARALKKGEATPQPVEVLDVAGKKTLTWLYLEDIINNIRPLSDQNVQIEIVRHLSELELRIALNTHIERLKQRASFTDIETMTQTLVDIAMERFWPAGT